MDYNIEIARQQSWQPPVNGITVTQVALGVTARAQADIDDLAITKKIVFDLSGAQSRALLLRIRSDGSEDDSNVLQLYLGRDKDHYIKIGQLTCLQGTQEAGNSTYFADTITPANEVALFSGVETNIVDSIAFYSLRTFGFDKLVIIVSSLASTTVYVDLVNVDV